MANRVCPCSAPQALVDEVFKLQVAMLKRMDPAWSFRMKQMAGLMIK